MKTPIKLLCLLALGLGLAPGLFAQTTAFTYQGRLNQGGIPATGIYDMQFSLFNVASGGGAIAGPLSQTLGVTGGLFTASLDFTGTQFTGQNLWLQIGVRSNGVGGYNNLTPRQAITSTPYAIRSINSGTANSAATATSATTANGVAPNGVNSTALQNGAVSLGKLATGVLHPSNFPPNSVTSAQLADFIALGSNNVNGQLDVYRTAAGTPSVSLIGADSRISTYGSDGLEQIRLWGAGWGELLLYNNSEENGLAAVLSANGASGVLRLFDPGGSEPARISSTGSSWLAGGNVGVGIATPATRLHVYSPFNGTTVRIQSAAGFGSARMEFWSDPFGSANEWRPGFIESTDNGGYTGGLGFYVNGTGYANRQSAFEVMRLVNGNVGIGTASPAERLHVNGGYVRVEGFGGEQAYLGGDGAGGDVQIGSFNPAVTAVALWNAPNGEYMNLYVKSITITGGADLAEPFEMSHKEIPQGAVVVIDEENPGRLKMSTEAYDSRVAGIVSGAGGINPGIQLKQAGALDGGQNVALTGRVYALADATSAPIKPGDLLTTSATPGHCMKAGDRDRAQGAILGKAMTGLKEGRNKVLVLVTLQ